MKAHKSDILIADDEEDIRLLMAGILEDEGHHVRQAKNSQEVMDQIEKRVPGLVILDVWLKESRLNGMELLEMLHSLMPSLPIIMISGHATVDIALQATRKGANDFLTKPFKSNILLYVVEKSLKTKWLKNQHLTDLSPDEGLTGDSSSLQAVNRDIEKLARNNSRVLIFGEIGTGKTTAALQIHRRSKRMKTVFLQLDCGLIQADKIESMLYGVSTNARAVPSVGMLEQAHGGSLVLENVEEMPLSCQARLSRVLHENRFQRIGGNSFVDVDVRIFATTKIDLKQATKTERFLPDLHHRLNVASLYLPPLRERRDDIIPLAKRILALTAERNQWAMVSLSEEAMVFLRSNEWLGNIWELRNLLERLLILSINQKITEIKVEVIQSIIADNVNFDESIETAMTERLAHLPLRAARDAFERLYLEHQLRLYQGNISRAASHIGMDRSALHRKMKLLGLQSERFEKNKLSKENASS